LPDVINIKVEGLKELERKLLSLGPKVGREALRSALGGGAQVIKSGARVLAPAKTGRLQRALYVKRMPKNNPFVEKMIVGVRHGKKMQKAGLDAFYWTFLEFGHLVRPKGHAGKNGKTIFSRTPTQRAQGGKVVAARPFLRPAFEIRKMAAMDRIKQVLQKKIAQYARGPA
jgi:HK97 gp10 family phage protein